jgi:hypothetical protein
MQAKCLTKRRSTPRPRPIAGGGLVRAKAAVANKIAMFQHFLAHFLGENAGVDLGKS